MKNSKTIVAIVLSVIVLGISYAIYDAHKHCVLIEVKRAYNYKVHGDKDNFVRMYVNFDKEHRRDYRLYVKEQEREKKELAQKLEDAVCEYDR